MTLEEKLLIFSDIIVYYSHDIGFIEYLSLDITSLHDLLVFCSNYEEIVLLVSILYNIYLN